MLVSNHVVPDTTGNTGEWVVMPFGEAVRYLRRLRGWTQAELADKIGVGQSTVANWEGLARPLNDPLTLMDLADALDIGVEELRAGRVARRGPASEASKEDLEALVARITRLHRGQADPRIIARSVRKLFDLSEGQLLLIDALLDQLPPAPVDTQVEVEDDSGHHQTGGAM